MSISKWSDEFQQLVPVDLQIIADTAAALPDLLARVRSRLASDRPAQTRVRERTEAIIRVHALWIAAQMRIPIAVSSCVCYNSSV